MSTIDLTKILRGLVLCFCVTAPNLSAEATVIAGTEIQIGPSNTDQIPYGSANYPAYSGVFGTGNSLHAWCRVSVLIGEDNVIAELGNVLMVGYDNFVLSSMPAYGPVRSALVGDSNFLGARDTLVVGTLNSMNPWMEESSNGTWDSFSVGRSNSVDGNGHFVSGEDNLVTIDYIINPYYNQPINRTIVSAFGKGLVLSWNYSLVIGKYNDASLPANSGLTFAVGNGGSPSTRSNAVEVYNSGKVKFGRQGNVLMGRYGFVE